MFLRAGQMADLDARRTEVLGKAARIIQRLMRTYIARKQFVLVKRSATRLQSFVRGTALLCLHAHSLKSVDPLADGPCSCCTILQISCAHLYPCCNQGPWFVIYMSA